MNGKDFYIAIDIGAGLGIKLGLFTDPLHQIDGRVLHRNQFEDNIDSFLTNMLDSVNVLLSANGRRMDQARAIGIASPGLFASDGTYLMATNLRFFNGQNIKQLVADETGLPTGIENDANAGGLAEWSVLKVDILYWVFGGGWGGTWISKEGNVMFSALDWDENDSSLHYTNEPGYAIPLDKLTLRTMFYQHEASYDRFEQIVIDELKPDDGILRGPNNSPNHIRAEVILSGPGRVRLFQTIVADEDFYKRFLDINETSQMIDSSIAGQHISKLSNMRVESAVQTDRLFGHILAEATKTMFRQARNDSIPEGLPICLGGKPSYALPYFGPSAQSRIGSKGIMSYLRPSVIDERGLNANLVGAAVLAEKTFNKHNES